MDVRNRCLSWKDDDRPDQEKIVRTVRNYILLTVKSLTMSKTKTNSGAKKRFKLTGTGKLKRKHAYKSHILTKKTKKQKRNLTHFAIVHSADEKRVKALLGM